MTLSPGVYRISAYGTHGQPQVLTSIDGGNVTVSPPSSVPSGDQEWRLEILENGNVAIQNPANIFPSRSLSYKEPQEGEKIVLGPPFDFPTREWRVESAPQRPLPVPYFIRIPDKELIVVVSPIRIHPPQLQLQSADGRLDNA